MSDELYPLRMESDCAVRCNMGEPGPLCSRMRKTRDCSVYMVVLVEIDGRARELATSCAEVLGTEQFCGGQGLRLKTFWGLRATMVTQDE